MTNERQPRGLARREKIGLVWRAVDDEQDRLRRERWVAAGEGGGVQEGEFAALQAEAWAIVSEAQVVVAEALADVAGEDGQAGQGDLARADQLGALASLGHHREIRQQGAQCRPRLVWNAEADQVVELDMQKLARDAHAGRFHVGSIAACRA